MNLAMIFQLVLAACVGVAFLSNLLIYFAFKAHKVDASFARSIKPGYIENVYRQTPALHSPLLAFVIRLAATAKVLTVIAIVAFVVLRALGSR